MLKNALISDRSNSGGEGFYPNTPFLDPLEYLSMISRPFKKRSFYFCAAFVFFHHLSIRYPPVPFLAKSINIYRSAASALKFSCLVHTSRMAGMGVYKLGWSSLFNSLKMRGLTPYTDALFSAHHDEIIEIYIFSNENWGLPPAFLVKK